MGKARPVKVALLLALLLLPMLLSLSGCIWRGDHDHDHHDDHHDR
ncbi:MAG: hypothetical protein ABSA67_02385 [Candidatus Brocadiia bacterium]|jgi:hypothetical protein